MNLAEAAWCDSEKGARRSIPVDGGKIPVWFSGGEETSRWLPWKTFARSRFHQPLLHRKARERRGGVPR